MVIVVNGVEAPASNCGYVGFSEFEAAIVTPHIATVIGDDRDGEEVDEFEANSSQGPESFD
jgi:hypothetical protein